MRSGQRHKRGQAKSNVNSWWFSFGCLQFLKLETVISESKDRRAVKISAETRDWYKFLWNGEWSVTNVEANGFGVLKFAACVFNQFKTNFVFAVLGDDELIELSSHRSVFP